MQSNPKKIGRTVSRRLDIGKDELLEGSEAFRRRHGAISSRTSVSRNMDKPASSSEPTISLSAIIPAAQCVSTRVAVAFAISTTVESPYPSTSGNDRQRRPAAIIRLTPVCRRSWETFRQLFQLCGTSGHTCTQRANCLATCHPRRWDSAAESFAWPNFGPVGRMILRTNLSVSSRRSRWRCV